MLLCHCSARTRTRQRVSSTSFLREFSHLYHPMTQRRVLAHFTLYLSFLQMTNNPMNGAPAKAAAPAKAGMAAWKIAALAGFAGLTVAAVVVGASVYYGYEKTHTEKEVEVVVPEWGRFEIDETGALWTYEKEGVNGPAHWGTYLNATAGTPYYPTCADTVNSQQSPIDIVDAATTAGNGGSAIHLFRNYTTTAFKIKARPGGHPGFQMIPLNGVAMFMVDGVRYDLIQFHYHSPSEHTVNGVQVRCFDQRTFCARRR